MENKDKIILDLCGGTGAWSKPYRDAGYDVRLITLPNDDVISYFPPEGVYGILSAPPCTEFTKANWRVNKSGRNFRKGMRVVKACMEIIWMIQEKGAPLKFWALENPMGYLYNFLGQPAFYFQPWQFGEIGFLATKRTAIWGYFNRPGKTILKRNVPYIRSPKTTKSTNSNPGWQKCSVGGITGKTRQERRAITPQGFARAFYEANK